MGSLFFVSSHISPPTVTCQGKAFLSNESASDTPDDSGVIELDPSEKCGDRAYTTPSTRSVGTAQA